MVACQKNEPIPQNDESQPKSETVEQLNDFIDGIGTIVESDTLQNGSVVMKDDKGNTITQDKEGNITIVTKDGETILIDSSINEDKSAPKDKWFHSTWSTGENNEPMPGDFPEVVPAFVDRLLQLGFYVEQKSFSYDSTYVEQKDYSKYTLHFNNTTGSLQQIDTILNYTYTRSINYLEITLFPDVIGDGETRYELINNEGRAELYVQYYHYNYESEQYEFETEWLDSALEWPYLDEDNTFLLYQGTETKDVTTEVVAAKMQTTWFNYRRLDDFQLAVSNNSASYLLKEETGNDVPILRAYDLDGNYLLRFELASL